MMMDDIFRIFPTCSEIMDNIVMVKAYPERGPYQIVYSDDHIGEIKEGVLDFDYDTIIWMVAKHYVQKFVVESELYVAIDGHFVVVSGLGIAVRHALAPTPLGWTIGKNIDYHKALAIKEFKEALMKNLIEYSTNGSTSCERPDILHRKLHCCPEPKIPVPIVLDVKVYNNRVVKVIFDDGSFTKAVCSENDTFNLDAGITVCMMKKMLGENGKNGNAYCRMLSDIHKGMERREKEREKKKEWDRQQKERNRKAQAKREAKHRKKVEEQIDIHAKAIIRARNGGTL